jgi:hypothetical protein
MSKNISFSITEVMGEDMQEYNSTYSERRQQMDVVNFTPRLPDTASIQ